MPELFRIADPYGRRMWSSPVYYQSLLQLVSLAMLLISNIDCEVTDNQQQQSSIRSSLDECDQLEVTVKLETNKQNSPTKLPCQTTFISPQVYVNNDTTSQLASTLEPVYFGTYPVSTNNNNNRNQAMIRHFLQQRSASTLPNHFFVAPSVLDHTRNLPNLGSSFYQHKDSSSPRDVVDDPIARPVFEQDVNDDQGENDGQIVTLQAFGSDVDKTDKTRTSDDDVASTPTNTIRSTRFRENLMDMLRKLPANKQVQLINRYGSASSVPLERPLLNLVSGSMRVAGPATSHLIPIGQSVNTANQEELVRLLNKINTAEDSEQNSGSKEMGDDTKTVSDTDQPVSHNAIREEDKNFLKSLIQGLNIPIENENSNLPASLETTPQAKQESNQQQTIPIARLVDHLMENSRLSTFGVQHGDGLPELPEDEEEVNEVNPNEEEDEEEDEEEEPENENNEEAQESGLVVQRRLSPMMQGFSAILNQSSSWIPLDSSERVKKPLGSLQKMENDLKNDPNNKKTSKSGKKSKGKANRKKKSKKKKEVLGLIVGDRVFSNADLVRLIEILNKLASKGKTKAERESSKKLLKYLIKLMLEEYKKKSTKTVDEKRITNKVDPVKKEEDKSVKLDSGSAGSIRDLLRPHLESPTVSKDDESKKLDAASFSHATKHEEEKPTSEKKLAESELKKLEKQEVKDQEKPMNINDKKKDISNESDEHNKKSPKNNSISYGLDKLTEDLEHYFDTDFYEDMADNLNRNKTHISLASGTRLTRVPRHRRRPSRLIYTVPVPVYGQQLFEAADEEDTDFDAVTIPLSMRRHQPTARRRSYARRRPVSKRSKKRREQPTEAVEAAEPEEEEEEEPEEEEEHEEVTAEKDQPPIDQTEEHPVAASDQNLNAEPVEKEAEQAEPIELERIQDQPSDQTQDNLPERPVIKDPPRRIRRKRRRKSVLANKYRGSYPKKEIDYDSRYEIPAPIGSGGQFIPSHHISSAANGRGVNKRFVPRARQSHQVKVQSNPRKVAASSKNIIRKIKPKNHSKIPKPSIERNRRTRNDGSKKPTKLSRRRKPPGKRDPDEPATGDPGPGEADEDYYNDSSSYTKICDDDNKCEVKVHKSGPKKTYRKTEI